MKFKMAATAGLSLTLYGNVSKCFFSETTWTVQQELNPLQGVCFLCRSEIQDGCHSINYGENKKLFFSEITNLKSLILHSIHAV